MLGLILLSLLLAGILVWLLSPLPGGKAADPIEPPDLEELEAAEREVRDLDAGTTPKEVEDRDWGPGAPR